MEDFQLDLIIGEGPRRPLRPHRPAAVHPGRGHHAGWPARHTLCGTVSASPSAWCFIHRGRTHPHCRPRRRKARPFALTREGATEIARRSRGTPRIAGRLLRRVRDFASVQGQAVIDRDIADAALLRLEVDALGLDAMDRRYLRRMAEHHGGGPVGVETLAAALAEARDTLEDVIEPYLIQEGLMLRTSRGRMLGEPGWRHLGLTPPPPAQDSLL